MRRSFCFSRSWVVLSVWCFCCWLCWPGGNVRISTAHLAVKHFSPLWLCFSPSRRHKRHFGPIYFATLISQPRHDASSADDTRYGGSAFFWFCCCSCFFWFVVCARRNHDQALVFFFFFCC